MVTRQGLQPSTSTSTSEWSLEGGVRRRQGLQPTVSKKQPMDQHIVSDCVIVNAIDSAILLNIVIATISCKNGTLLTQAMEVTILKSDCLQEYIISLNSCW